VCVFFHRDHVKKSLLPGSSQWFRNGVPGWRSSIIDKCANPTTFSALAQLLVAWVLLRFCNEFVAIIKKHLLSSSRFTTSMYVEPKQLNSERDQKKREREREREGERKREA
jgi:hypothetical protein